MKIRQPQCKRSLINKQLYPAHPKLDFHTRMAHSTGKSPPGTVLWHSLQKRQNISDSNTQASQWIQNIIHY